MDEKEKSKIDWLNDVLYSRTRYRASLGKRSPVKELDPPVGGAEISEKWQTPDLDEMLKHERIPPKISSFMKKIFIFAIVFFIAAIGFAGFIFLGGANFISSKNVDISVFGPTVISYGEALELGITISNTNNTDLEFASLSIQYPQGSRNPNNTSELLTYTKEDLGVIEAGAEVIHNARAVILGSSGERKEIKLSVEYKVRGSNAIFYKDKIFEVVIGGSPIALTVENPSSIVSGEPFTTNIFVTFNAPEMLKNVILKVEYPHGYSVLESSPEPVADNNVWVLGDLIPGSKKTISIRGKLIGEDKDERTFRFYAGVSDSLGANNNLKTVIVSLLDAVVIDRPSIGMNILFNGENVSTYLAPAARLIKTSVKLRNNLSDKLLNPLLEVSLSGAVLDKLSVVAGNNGLYNPDSSKVVWNLTNNLGLREIAPGEDGRVTLEFSSLPSLSLPTDDQDITLNFSLTGISVGSIEQSPVVVNETRIVRISSQVNLSSKALRSLGPFVNHGPIPPKLGEETTYAIVFGLGNTMSDLADAKVTATLAQGVSWLGGSSFTSEDISYDSPSHTVTWNMGTLPSGTGFSSAAREMAFQIAFTPSLDQIGTTPNLVNSIFFSARDTGTGKMVTVNNPPLTTRLISDPVFIEGDDIVVK